MAKPKQTVKEGLIVGLIGYASVAFLYAVFDFLAARGPLFTVDLLGKALFNGLHDLSVLFLPIELDANAIFWYNILHLIVSLVIGLIVMGLFKQAEKQQTDRNIILFILIMGFLVTIAAMGFLTNEIRSLLPWWSIIMANMLAVILAGSYIFKKFPDTVSKLNPFHKE